MQSEARKNDHGKSRTDLLPPKPLLEVASVFGFGASKYGDWNWRAGGGLAASRLYAAAMRHLLAWYAGEDKDPESGYSHLAHAVCSLLMLMDSGGPDDRPKSNVR